MTMSENPNAASLALDALEENLRKVLLHTGSALTSASQNAGAKLDHTRLHVEKVLPEFLKQWHAALNELEGELVSLYGSEVSNAPNGLLRSTRKRRYIVISLHLRNRNRTSWPARETLVPIQ